LEIEIACSQWEGSAHTHDGPCFFFLFRVGWGEVGGVIFCFSSLFPMCAQHVLKRFPNFQCVPQDVPNSTSVLLHMVCPKFNSHVYNKLKRYSIGKYICFYFATWDPKRSFHWGVLNMSKKLLMGQSIWLLQKKEKKFIGAHMN
jgi:hypothetical protein